MFIEMFESKDIKDARNKRKQFVESLRKDINDPKKQLANNMLGTLKDREALKGDWNQIGNDFPTR